MESQRDHREINTAEGERKSGTESWSPDQVQETINKPAFINIQKRLVKFEERKKIEGDLELSQANRSNSSRNSVCIYKLPQNIRDRVKPRYLEPVVVSTSPYHLTRGDFEDSTKLELVNSLLNKTLKGKDVVVQDLVLAMEELETKVSDSYSEPIEKSYLLDMMVFDGCFIVELLRHLCTCLDENDESFRHGSPILKDPEQIRELAGDLLKLENQLPFFVLENIFDICIKKGNKTDPLRLVALKLFGHYQPICGPESLKRSLDPNFKVEHLLHLFHYSCTTPILNPQNFDQRQLMTPHFSPWISVAFRYLFNLFQRVNTPLLPRTNTQDQYHPLSNKSMQCATRLQLAGIKFKPRRRSESFLQIEFRDGVLEIPPIHVNRVIITALLNCIAWEQCRLDHPRYFSDYIGFMNCLIKSERDVTLLREDGIIRRKGYNDDLNNADIFKLLGDKVVYEARYSYLSKQVNEVEAYCRGNWTSLRRKYFSNRWAFISVAAATVALVLTAIQTIMAILAYIKPPLY